MISARVAVGVVLGCLVVGVLPMQTRAALLPFNTDESSLYLIIARERINGNTDVAVNNFELGANKAPVPSTDSFLDGGSTGGSTLLGAVPSLPANAAPVFQGVGGGGNIALMDSSGEFEFQDVGIYADAGIGIRVGAPNDSYNKSGNAFFNDPNMYPNTFNIVTQTGSTVDENDADPLTRIDPSGNGNPSANVGVTYGYDHTALVNELAAAKTAIEGLAATGTLNVSGNGGKISSDTTISLPSGLSVIDIITGDNDFLVENSNLVIDGPDDAIVIFRMPDDDNMLVSNSNILIGNGGIGPGSILFFTSQSEDDTHFDFSNAILNQVAFWSLGRNGGAINVSNSQGCVQFVADIVDLDDVRYNRCSFVGTPEPATLALVLLGGLALLIRRKQ